MIVPASNLRHKGSSTGRTLLRSLLLAVLLAAAAWFVYVAQQISEVADHDEAQQADAIAVFGAAEYLGRPSLKRPALLAGLHWEGRALSVLPMP